MLIDGPPMPPRPASAAAPAARPAAQAATRPVRNTPPPEPLPFESPPFDDIPLAAPPPTLPPSPAPRGISRPSEYATRAGKSNTKGIIVKAAVVFGVLLGIVGAYVGWSALSAGRERAMQIKCTANLRTISLLCRMYQEQFQKYPDNFGNLVRTTDASWQVFVCPDVQVAAPPTNLEGDPKARADWVNQNTTYVCLGSTLPGGLLAYERSENHRGRGANVLYANGSSGWLSATELQVALAAPSQAVEPRPGFGLVPAPQQRPRVSASTRPRSDVANATGQRPAKPPAPDLAAERAAYATRLTSRGPAPQKWVPEPVPPDAQDVEYASGNLKLRGWLGKVPQSTQKLPAVVYCHGGFSFGADDWKQSQPFRDAGYVVFMPRLRAENGNPGFFECFYGEVDDVVAAGQYLAALDGVDASRVHVTGHSAGATVAMLAAMLPNPFASAASYDGSPDQSQFFAAPQWKAIAPFDARNDLEIRLRSPRAFAGSLRCPLYAYYSTSGPYGVPHLIVQAEAIKYAKTCKATAVPGDHYGMVPEAIKRTLAQWELDHRRTRADQ
jgi:acetyl esterase/lipase/type II secretory pathway pseudopilin PulG